MTAGDPAELARAEIRALKPYASARALADAAGILLNANENPWPPAGDDGMALNRYPDPQPAALRARLAALYGVAENRMLITRGSDEGIDLLQRAFCRPDVDRVLVCPPCFGMYALSARIQGVEVVEARLVDRGREFDLPGDLLARASGCKLAFLCSPNNPTGHVIDPERVAELADSLAGTGLLVVDEAYIEFAPETSVLALLDAHRNLVVLRTLSKAHALAGCRLGSVIADAGVIELLRRIIAPYPLATPTVNAAMRALSSESLAVQRRHLETLAAEKARIVGVLDDHPGIVNVWPGRANFVLARAVDGAGLVSAAAAAGIRLRDQSAQPGLADCVRVTVGAPDENDALIEFLQGWRP